MLGDLQHQSVAAIVCLESVEDGRELLGIEFDVDDGTNDLIVSDVIRVNELEVWFVSEHLVDVPLVRAT